MDNGVGCKGTTNVVPVMGGASRDVKSGGRQRREIHVDVEPESKRTVWGLLEGIDSRDSGTKKDMGTSGSRGSGDGAWDIMTSKGKR